MRTELAHLQFNVAPANIAYYRDLLAFLGWQPLADGEGLLGVGGEQGVSLWFIGSAKDVVNDYDGPGLNPLAIGAASPTQVDAVAAYLAERGVARLFETPRHRPEFAPDAEHTYYQVMFESPDRILFEVVYTGPRVV